MGPGVCRREVVERALLRWVLAVYSGDASPRCLFHVHGVPLSPATPRGAHGAGHSGSAQHLETPGNAIAIHQGKNAMTIGRTKKVSPSCIYVVAKRKLAAVIRLTTHSGLRPRPLCCDTPKLTVDFLTETRLQTTCNYMTIHENFFCQMLAFHCYRTFISVTPARCMLIFLSPSHNFHPGSVIIPMYHNH